MKSFEEEVKEFKKLYRKYVRDYLADGGGVNVFQLTFNTNEQHKYVYVHFLPNDAYFTERHKGRSVCQDDVIAEAKSLILQNTKWRTDDYWRNDCIFFLKEKFVSKPISSLLYRHLHEVMSVDLVHKESVYSITIPHNPVMLTQVRLILEKYNITEYEEDFSDCDKIVVTITQNLFVFVEEE